MNLYKDKNINRDEVRVEDRDEVSVRVKAKFRIIDMNINNESKRLS